MTMKKFILSGFLAIVTTVALAALPAPSKIEKAISEHRLDDARSMVNEVLKERPDVARARLLNAYILLKKEKDVPAATKELEAVKALDVKGDVVNSPMFAKVKREIEANTVAVAMAAPPVIPKDESGFPFGWILLFVVLGGGAWYFFVKKKDEPLGFTPSPTKVEDPVDVPDPVFKPTQRSEKNYAYPRSSGVARPPRKVNETRVYPAPPPRPQVVNNYYSAGGSSRSGNGSNFGSTFAGTTAGVVAGAVIADAILNKDTSPSYSPAPAPSTDSWDPIPSSTSSSRDDSWSSPSSGSSSSSSDSWSSSSSSSSSSDSWSSSDSSSSSSDSSW